VPQADLDEAFRLIDAAPETQKHVAGPVSDAMIADAESLLAVTFPASFQAFLRRYGCGGVGPVDIYGLYHPVDATYPMPPPLISYNLDERAEGMPLDILLIESCGTGDHYALELTSPGFSGEPRVVVWPFGGCEDRDWLEPVADDFSEFLRARVSKALQVIEEFSGKYKTSGKWYASRAG